MNFGRKMAKWPTLYATYTFSTSLNLCHRTTLLNTDVPNCCITLEFITIRLRVRHPSVGRPPIDLLNVNLVQKSRFSTCFHDLLFSRSRQCRVMKNTDYAVFVTLFIVIQGQNIKKKVYKVRIAQLLWLFMLNNIKVAWFSWQRSILCWIANVVDMGTDLCSLLNIEGGRIMGPGIFWKFYMPNRAFCAIIAYLVLPVSDGFHYSSVYCWLHCKYTAVVSDDWVYQYLLCLAIND